MLYSYINSYLYLIYLYTGTVILKRFISIEAFSIFRIYNQQVLIAVKLILYFFCLILSYFSSCRFFIIKLQFCSDSFCYTLIYLLNIISFRYLVTSKLFKIIFSFWRSCSLTIFLTILFLFFTQMSGVYEIAGIGIWPWYEFIHHKSFNNFKMFRLLSCYDFLSNSIWFDEEQKKWWISHYSWIFESIFTYQVTFKYNDQLVPAYFKRYRYLNLPLPNTFIFSSILFFKTFKYLSNTCHFSLK